MEAVIIDGKAIAAALCETLKQEVSALAARGVTPGLRVILVGEDPASMLYVANKEKKAASLGIDSRVIRLPQGTTQAALLALIAELNADDTVHGILVQLPLPKHICAETVTGAILPNKDVDGLHPENAGNLLLGKPCLAPCTPQGILHLLSATGIPVSGKHAVVVGRSMLVGKPVSLLLLQQNATVTLCHSKTQDLPAITRQADILIAAVGKAGLITADMVKPGAVVIDVGTNKTPSGSCGDVCFDEVKQAAGYITPVPGGVGPMTIAMLMQNTIAAAKRR